MRKVTFRQIEAFRAVMVSGSISAGAIAMGLTQPAVSRLVRDLEAHLKLRLFSRLGNSVQPTSEAEILNEEVAREFAGIDRIQHAAALIRDTKKGTVRITAMIGAATRFLPTLVSQYIDRFPMARVTLQSAYSAAVVDGVANRRFDFGFAHVDNPDPAVEAELLTGLKVAVVLHRDDELASQAFVSVEDLHSVPLLALGHQSPVWEQFSGVLQSRGVKPRIACEAGAAETLCTLAALGKGIAIVDPFTAYGIVDPRITVRPLLPSIDYTISMIFPRGRPKPRSVVEFAKLVRKEVKALAEVTSSGVSAAHEGG